VHRRTYPCSAREASTTRRSTSVAVGVLPTRVQLSSSVTSTSSSASTGGARSRLSTRSSTAADRKNTSRNVTCPKTCGGGGNVRRVHRGRRCRGRRLPPWLQSTHARSKRATGENSALPLLPLRWFLFGGGFSC
jgi:hypothetical protein